MSVTLVLLRFLVGFTTHMVLVRVLLPTHFGQFTQILIAVGFLGLLRSFHTGQYLISRKDEADADNALDVLFTFELIQSLTVAALGLVLAGPLVRLAGGAGLEHGVWVMLISFLVLPFGFTGSMLERQLAFGRSYAPAMVGTLISPAIKISLALTGFGLWSLLIGEVVRMTLEVCLLWRLSPRKPRIAFDRAILKEAVAFGLPLVAAGALAYYYWQIDDIVVGRLFGTQMLGYYFLAFRIPRYLYQFREQLAQVTYPVLVRLDSQGQMTPGFEAIMRYAAYFSGLPLVVTLLFAEPLIRVLFGEKWLPATQALQILMGATTLRVVIGLSGDVFKVRSKTGMFLLANGLNAVTLSALVYPLTRDYGIAGTAWAVLLTLIPSSLVGLVVLKRLAPISLTRSLWAPLIVIGAVSGLGFALRQPIDGPLTLALGVGCATLAYLLSMLLLDRRLIREMRWIRGALRRSDTPPTTDAEPSG